VPSNRLSVGEVGVDVRARTEQFVRGLEVASRQLGLHERAVQRAERTWKESARVARSFARQALSLRNAFFAIGGAGGGLTLLIRQQAAFAEQLKTQSDLTGVSVRDIQQLSYALGSYGVDLDTVSDFLRELSLRQREAIDDNDDVAAAFRQIGVEFADAAGNARPLLEVIRDFARVLPQVNHELGLSTLDRIAGEDAQRVFGVLRQGLPNLERLLSVARDTTPGLSDAANDSLRELGRSLTRFANRFQEAIREALADNAPQIQSFFDDIEAALPDIVSGFERLASAVRDGIGFLVEHGPTILKILGALKGASVGATAGALAGAPGGPLGSLIGTVAGGALGAGGGAAGVDALIDRLGGLGQSGPPTTQRRFVPDGRGGYRRVGAQGQRVVQAFRFPEVTATASRITGTVPDTRPLDQSLLRPGAVSEFKAAGRQAGETFAAAAKATILEQLGGQIGAPLLDSLVPEAKELLRFTQSGDTRRRELGLLIDQLTRQEAVLAALPAGQISIEQYEQVRDIQQQLLAARAEKEQLDAFVARTAPLRRTIEGGGSIHDVLAAARQVDPVIAERALAAARTRKEQEAAVQAAREAEEQARKAAQAATEAHYREITALQEKRYLLQQVGATIGAFFSDAITGADNLIDRFRQLADQIASLAIQRLVVEPLVTSVVNSVAPLPAAPAAAGKVVNLSYAPTITAGATAAEVATAIDESVPRVAAAAKAAVEEDLSQPSRIREILG